MNQHDEIHNKHESTPQPSKWTASDSLIQQAPDKALGFFTDLCPCRFTQVRLLCQDGAPVGQVKKFTFILNSGLDTKALFGYPQHQCLLSDLLGT